VLACGGAALRHRSIKRLTCAGGGSAARILSESRNLDAAKGQKQPDHIIHPSIRCFASIARFDPIRCFASIARFDPIRCFASIARFDCHSLVYFWLLHSALRSFGADTSASV
jgi:hypothetical protein